MSGENLPEDALGTVRAEPSGVALAIRCNWENDDVKWVVVDIAEDGPGFTEMPDIGSWPVVYRRGWAAVGWLATKGQP